MAADAGRGTAVASAVKPICLVASDFATACIPSVEVTKSYRLA